MREVVVNRNDLLAKVKANREKHVKEFEETVKGYKVVALKALDDAFAKLKRNLEELKAGQSLDLTVISFDIDVPKNHASDYDRAISMLEMSVDDNVKIDERMFNQLVMDNWEWQHEFKASHSNYTKGY